MAPVYPVKPSLGRPQVARLARPVLRPALLVGRRSSSPLIRQVLSQSPVLLMVLLNPVRRSPSPRLPLANRWGVSPIQRMLR